MTKISLRAGLFGAAALAMAGTTAAVAHHSFAAEFDRS